MNQVYNTQPNVQYTGTQSTGKTYILSKFLMQIQPLLRKIENEKLEQALQKKYRDIKEIEKLHIYKKGV